LFGGKEHGEETWTLAASDLLVDMEPGRSLLDLVGLCQELEDLLCLPVEVLSEAGVSPHLHDRIYAEAVPL